MKTNSNERAKKLKEKTIEKREGGERRKLNENERARERERRERERRERERGDRRG